MQNIPVIMIEPYPIAKGLH